jgi:acetyl esterase/lipase
MPSWQAKAIAAYCRLFVKRHSSGTETEIAAFCRARLQGNEYLRPRLPKDVTVTPVDEESVRGEWVRSTESTDNTLYYLHGGGYIACSPATHRGLTAAIARQAKTRVFALDYRLAPEHRFPAPVEDAVAGYHWLLSQGIDPQKMVIGGDSAGGGLALATLLALRDAEMPLPRAAFCLSPWTDTAATGSSIIGNDKSDAMFYGEMIGKVGAIYAPGESARHPLASPVYADFRGLPPLRIYASSSEVLLDDSTRVAENARRAGVSVDLRIWENLIHVWPVFAALGVPESTAAVAEIAEFIVSPSETRSIYLQFSTTEAQRQSKKEQSPTR